jgi:two-component system, LytTR family, sensor kinase
MAVFSQLQKKQAGRQVFIWFMIIAYMNLSAPVPGSWSAKIIGGGLESLNYILFFYVLSLVVFPKFWVRRKIFWLIVLILLCYVCYVSITYLNYVRIIKYLGGYSFHMDEPIQYLWLDGVFYFFIICSAGAASFYYRYSIDKIKLRSENEKVLLVKELNFLKNQFNSHITFNFLNYCYSKIHKILPGIAESVGLFSENLRYALQTKPEEKVLLTKELANLENFVSLQRLLNKNVQLKIENLGELSDKYIFPRILISLVENVLIFGISNDPQAPIQIHLKTNDLKLEYTINSKLNSDDLISNIQDDLNFVSQTLKLYYPNRYLFSHKINEGKIIIQLYFAINEANANSSEPVISSKNLNVQKKSSFNDGGLSALMGLSKKQISWHILAWILIIAYTNILTRYTSAIPVVIIINVMVHMNLMFVFYGIGFYGFPKFWEERRISLVVFIIVALLIYWIIAYITFKVIMPALGEYVYIEKFSVYMFLKDRLYLFIFYGSAGVFSFFTRYGVFKIKQQEQKEKMLLGKELFYLKNQFNSPLIFSFLQYCSANIRKHSPETADSIVLFSDMLRYTLQTPPEEKVLLKDEIIYIEDFISIQKLLSEKVFVNFNCSGVIENKKILSRILVTFVENAFKHGLYNNSTCPLQISLVVKEQELSFSIINRINPTKRIESTNKGIENVTQILDLYYADKYTLKKEVADQNYSLELSMQLNE